jgi:hypothetical protein
LKWLTRLKPTSVVLILNKYATVDDGNWHHVVFLWSNDTGGNYIIDNLSQGTNTVMYSGHTFDDE